MSQPMIMWLVLTPIAFAIGFVLAWRQHKHRMQVRINQVVAEELQSRLSGEIQKRILQQLSGETRQATPKKDRQPQERD